MIDLYTWITPNGLKISVALEELGLPYRSHAIDIEKGEQFAADYIRINPGSKIPAIVDNDNDTVLTESNAILLYLAEKAGRLLPASATERLTVTEWLMWQAANFGPTLGYAHYFLTYHAGEAPFAETRFAADVERLYRTLNDRLTGLEYVAGNFSIADIAIWPWVSRFARHKINLDDFPAIQRWYRQLGQRESFKRGYRVPFATSDVPGL
ncbi:MULTISPECIES: glutathione S-transferase family protein [Rhizobium/Agrobacterium group]|uniref:Disulfide-bond oxidoreductase YfcG n=1 Tax=Agrobacterium tomkonis CFBP 6623 TaxID=1183432 RepID=A0A1S7S5L3_9HYPH|nr:MULTISPECIES: glutathione S-transferase N-terminal domain-containing protein [Rhizobium/Agrobacterium group]KRA55258.1 glutathione S-transferase [Rhizobium sp. Root651]MCZ7451766.1 glutathione S-transferase N-terminal domain-containing protein [Rhizobium rhizogenes]QCL90823.1 glutathione S-transferase [Agrobacterium tumefaciens]TKT57828.1 glutathione S-transferase [Agrobacterium sp. LC34]CUX63069.1 Disulfide-bond oxidoreductase YfcG [Agrobacterium tomkonis CFBP 6623]